jgi:predicted methyltransferase
MQLSFNGLVNNIEDDIIGVIKYDPIKLNKLGKWLYYDKNGNYTSCVRIIKPDGEPANYPD